MDNNAQRQTGDEESYETTGTGAHTTSEVPSFDAIQRRTRDLINNFDFNQLPQSVDRAVHDYPFWSVGVAFAVGIGLRALTTYAPEGSFQRIASYGGRALMPALANAVLRR